MLELADIASFLMARELLSARAVVDGRLRIVDMSRLNRVFLVTAEHERCFVLKLSSDAGGTSVAREAAVVKRLVRAAARAAKLQLPISSIRATCARGRWLEPRVRYQRPQR